MTIVKGKDNIFNEDFHVVHHTKPNAHWTGNSFLRFKIFVLAYAFFADYPKYYQDSIKEYEKYNATIFTDCEEGF